MRLRWAEHPEGRRKSQRLFSKNNDMTIFMHFFKISMKILLCLHIVLTFLDWLAKICGKIRILQSEGVRLGGAPGGRRKFQMFYSKTNEILQFTQFFEKVNENFAIFTYCFKISPIFREGLGKN